MSNRNPNAGRQQITLNDLLQHTITTDSGCMEWQRGRLKAGYGQFWFRGSSRLAHRLAATLAHGEPAKGMFALHSCDNPPCINPDHLRWGTHSENMNEMYERKGAPKRRPRSDRRFTTEQVQSIRSDYANGIPSLQLAGKWRISQRSIISIVSCESYKD